MSRRLRARRLLALATVLALTVTGLTLTSAPLEASAASVSADAASIIAKLNKKRVSKGIEKFETNGALRTYAQAWAESFASGGRDFAAINPPPVDAATGLEPKIRYNADVGTYYNGAEMRRVDDLVWALTAPYKSAVWNVRGYSHAAIGLVTKGPRIFYVLVVADYPECAPLSLSSTTPTIAGSGLVGEQLVANPGRWSKTPVRFRYEWRIEGRIVSDTRYYVPGREDAGKRVSVTVEGNKECYITPSARTSATKAIRASRLPVVTGSRNVGSTLTVDPGTWFAAGSTLSYEWIADGFYRGLPTTSPTLVLDEENLGERMSVEVTATLGSKVVSKRTPITLTTHDRLLPFSPDPVVTGSPTVGSTLTVDPGMWGSTVELFYEWRVNGATVDFEWDPTFTIPASAAGKKVTAVVTGWREGYAETTRTSASTAAVARATFGPANIHLDGSATVGDSLWVEVDWPYGSEHCQWYRDGRALSGIASCYLRVTSNLRGASLTVKVTAKAPGYTTKSETSTPVTVQ